MANEYEQYIKNCKTIFRYLKKNLPIEEIQEEDDNNLNLTIDGEYFDVEYKIDKTLIIRSANFLGQRAFDSGEKHEDLFEQDFKMIPEKIWDYLKRNKNVSLIIFEDLDDMKKIVYQSKIKSYTQEEKERLREIVLNKLTKDLSQALFGK